VDCTKADRYKRQVCVVYRDSLDINPEQVRAGLGWWYRQYSREQTPEQREAYEAAEVAARGERMGLWSDAQPVAPSEWRRVKR
jgi:endonuclease YncB( thermonuclease family)